MMPRVWLALLLIVISIVAVYYPSLRHVPRSDQIVYLYEVAHLKDWPSLALGQYDLNRKGTYAPGDERLFRPGLYFILGNEKYFFGYNWVLWQAFGILLHVIVVLLMARLLWLIKPGAGALLMTAFFALLSINWEMVIFTHLNSYMVFVAGILAALIQVVQLTSRQQQQPWRWIALLASLLLASSCFEAGIIYSFLIVGYVLIMTRPLMRQVKLFFLPLIVGVVAQPLWWWLVGGLFANGVEFYFSGRNMIVDTWVPDLSALHVNDGYMWYMLFLIGVWVYMASVVSQYPLTALVVVMLGVLSAIIAFGRGSMQGLGNALHHNVHYFYLAWSLITVIVYAAASYGRPIKGLLKVFVYVALILVAVLNGYRVYQMNHLQAQAQANTRELLMTIDELVKNHHGDKAFSFSISENFPGNYPYHDQFNAQQSLIGMLYPSYINATNPKYRFELK